MNTEMNILLENIAKDFAEWKARGDYGDPSDYDKMMSELSIVEGRKYLKVIRTDNQKTVWGFTLGCSLFI